MPRVTFQCNQSFLLLVSEKFLFYFYKSKILPPLQTLIKKSKNLISRTCEKSFIWKLVGLSRMLPVTFQGNPTQISRCKKKLFLQITTFALKLQDVVCKFTCWKKLKIIDFSNMLKKFSIKIGGVGRDRLCLVPSVLWAREPNFVRSCFSTKHQNDPYLR